MECIFLIKLIATTFGFTSAILLFLFGIPAMTESDTVSHLLAQGPEITKENIKYIKKFTKFKCIGKLALFLLFLSFVIQFIVIIIEK